MKNKKILLISLVLLGTIFFAGKTYAFDNPANCEDFDGRCVTTSMCPPGMDKSISLFCEPSTKLCCIKNDPDLSIIPGNTTTTTVAKFENDEQCVSNDQCSSNNCVVAGTQGYCSPGSTTTTTTNVNTPPPPPPPPGDTKCELNYEPIGGVCFPKDTGLSQATISSILLNVFTWLFGLFAVIAVSAFIISGIQYLTSAGNEDLLKTAKRNMTWSIVGVIVGLSGMVIVNAVAKALQGTNPFF